MPDKNLTDSEIIKALECCTTNGASCKDCPAFVKVDRSNCKKYFRGALDLINRQKAEIERLWTCVCELKREVAKHEYNYDPSDETQKIIENIMGEDGTEKFRARIKAEAHKELLQMLRREVLMCGEVNVEEFLEKLVGENNGD
jgi:hypothetical protein